jgi:uncharacterized protein YheU (UPF0270 family)
MHKVTTQMMIDINNLLDRSIKAMNHLQRSGGNKILYPELNKDLHAMVDRINSQYSLKEFTDAGERDKVLVEKKSRADKNWEQNRPT